MRFQIKNKAMNNVNFQLQNARKNQLYFLNNGESFFRYFYSICNFLLQLSPRTLYVYVNINSASCFSYLFQHHLCLILSGNLAASAKCHSDSNYELLFCMKIDYFWLSTDWPLALVLSAYAGKTLNLLLLCVCIYSR